MVTPRPLVRKATSSADHCRTIARGDASNSSIGTASACATFTSTASDGLPSPDSRLAMVERGTPASRASMSCVSPRVRRRFTRLRARWVAAGLDSSLLIERHCATEKRFANPLDIALASIAGSSDHRVTERKNMDNKQNFNGLRVAVTGGTSGLGLALVDALHAAGAQVAFIARDAHRVSAVALRRPGAHGIAGDVARQDAIHPLALQITSALGGLDILVNNAS